VCGNHFHAGDTAERRRDPAVRTDDAHLAGVLRDQEASVRKEGDRPGAGEAVRDDLDVERRRFLIRGRSGRQRLTGERRLRLWTLRAQHDGREADGDDEQADPLHESLPLWRRHESAAKRILDDRCSRFNAQRAEMRPT
jgi:hypothetical protein